MKEFIHVQFVAYGDDIDILTGKLKELGEDFLPISTNTDVEPEDDYYYRSATYPMTMVIGGKISSAVATLIKLQDIILEDRMQVSYIPEELKNKYRR